MKIMLPIIALLTGCAGYGDYPYYPMPNYSPSAQQYQMPMQERAKTVDCTTYGNQTTCRERPHLNILQQGCNPNFPATCVNAW